MSLDNLELNIDEIKEAANAPRNYEIFEPLPIGKYFAMLKKIEFFSDEQTGREYLRKAFYVVDDPENPKDWVGRMGYGYENIYVRNAKDGNATAISKIMRSLNRLIPAFWGAEDKGDFVQKHGLKFNHPKDLPTQHEAVVKKYGMDSETPAIYEIQVKPSGEKNVEIEVIYGYLKQ